MDHQQLAQTLVESFNALADEVQGLIDRKTILEHKLRFAHEQVCSGHLPPFVTRFFLPLLALDAREDSYDEFILALDLELPSGGHVDIFF